MDAGESERSGLESNLRLSYRNLVDPDLQRISLSRHPFVRGPALFFLPLSDRNTRNIPLIQQPRARLSPGPYTYPINDVRGWCSL